MRVLRALLPFLAAAPCACALVADLGDRTLGSLDAGTKPSDDDDDDDDDEPPRDGGDPSLPSYCDGIVLYASYEAQIGGDVGGTNPAIIGGVRLAPGEGKFGQGLAMTDNATGNGAALYYVGSDVWPAERGSIAMWFKESPGGSQAPTLYRPVGTIPSPQTGTTLVPSGLGYYLHNDNGDVAGLVESNQSPVLMYPTSSVDPFLRPGDFNHFFAAWQRGGTPTAFSAVNGGTGEAFGDTTGIDTPTEPTGGELRNPFRGYTSEPWDPGAAPAGLRIGGIQTNSPEGVVDDLVVWDRIVSFEELAALYASGKPVGETCKLR